MKRTHHIAMFALLLVLVSSFATCFFSVSANIPPAAKYTVPNNIYVMNCCANGYSLVTVLSGKKINTTVWVGDGAELQDGYVPLTKQVYIPDFGSNSVSVINVETNTVNATYLGFIEPVAALYVPVNKMVYIAQFGAFSLLALNPETGSVVAKVRVGANPEFLSYNPSNKMLYVSNVGSDTVSVVNPLTQKTVKTVHVLDYPRYIAYDPLNKDTYVSDEGNGTVSVISSSNKVVANITGFSDPWGVTFDKAMGDIVVVDDVTHNATFIAPNNRIVARIHLPGNLTLPFDVAFDDRTNLLYITNATYEGTIDIMKGTTLVGMVFNGNGEAPNGLCVV